MNTSPNRRKQVNPVHFSSLVRWMVIALLCGSAGLLYVYIKNQQFALGEEIRQVERRIKEIRSSNEVLLVRVTELSSRRALQQRIAEGFISVKPISDIAIARLTPPPEAGRDDVLRTAFNERLAQ